MLSLAVGDVLSVSAQRTPGRVAASLDDTVVRFAELETNAHVVARALAGRECVAGDRVVWHGFTSIDAIPLWFAAARLGLTFVPVDPNATDSETNTLLSRLDARLIVGDDAHDCDVTIEALRRDAPVTGVDSTEIDEHRTHAVFFTSGSSGVPKGVELSHRTLRLRLMTDCTHAPNGPYVCMFPQFHTAGWYGPMTSWANGDEVVFVRRADAEGILEAVDRRQATRFYGIPAVWRRILDADRGAFDLGSLRMCDTGTSATSPTLLREIAAAFPGTATSVTYGSTEAGGVCRLWPADIERNPGSVGPPGPGCLVRLAGDGELQVKNPFLFNGYFRDEAATAAAFDEGWFRTGDLAECDDEGYYSIVGRTKEIIRTGGESVAPVEVDQVLAGLPGVVEIAVAGVPDEAWGEVITAFAVLAPAARLTLDDVRARCEGTLATFKHPRRLVIVDSLPRTRATGQVKRNELVRSRAESSGEHPDHTSA